MAYIWLAQPTALSIAVGMPLVALGLALRAAAAGHVRKDRELTTSGPYAYTRNPLYLGSLIIGIGFAIAARSIWILIGLVILLIAIYWPLIRAEERYLRAHFPGYDEYAMRTPRLIPRFGISRNPKLETQTEGASDKLRLSGFSPDLYRKHREYRAIIGALFVFAILIAKILLRSRI